MEKQTQFESDELEIDRRERLRLPARRLNYRPINLRRQDFKEACRNFTLASAAKEAARCVECPAPQACVLACPLHNDIPRALWQISQGNFIEAARIYRQTSNFPELCGRLCPDEALCAGSCGVGKLHRRIRLGRLEATVADFQRAAEGLPVPELAAASGRRVAVVGSGPAGLAAAEELAKLGHAVTVYEMRRKPGGMLAYTIPRFRLPLEVVEAKVAQLERMGVSFVLESRIGRDTTLDGLFRQGYHAVFLSTGAGFELAVDLPGIDLAGVCRATDFLLLTNLDPAYSSPLGQTTSHGQVPLQGGGKVVVVGGGHSAVDCARTAVRLGAQQVFCILPEAEQEITCRMEDKLAAEEEGVRFITGVEALKLTGDDTGQVGRVAYRRKPGYFGDYMPEYQKYLDTEELYSGALSADLVVLAPERGPDPLAAEVLPGTSMQGWIIADPASGQTARPGVFAAGDNTGQTQLAVVAIARARQVVAHIHRYLSGLAV